MTCECKFCGDGALKQFSFCPSCFGQICQELQERIIRVGKDHGFECEHFQHEIETAMRFLLWLDGDDEDAEEKPSKPEFNPDDPDWWKK